MFSFKSGAFKIVVLCVAFLYVVFAIKSEGYLHEDEHFQIIQFAEYKLKNVNDVSWEYNARIRSTFQPTIVICIFSALRFLGIYDHFVLALVLRLVSAVFSLVVISLFYQSFRKGIDAKHHLFFLILSFGIWFLPYLNVRFSSEAWSGLIFMLAIVYLRKIQEELKLYKFFLLGSLLGLSIIFRFQSIALCFGLVMWCVFIGKANLPKVVLILSGLFVLLFLGVMLDTWFYGQFTISLINYINVNVFQGVALQFGTSPWYEIFFYILKYPTYPIGVILLLCFFRVFFKYPKHIVLWSILPFLLLHIISPHKELRFLFPLVNFVPLIVILCLISIEKYLSVIPPMVKVLLIVFLSVINTLSLFLIFYKGTRRGEIKIAKYLHERWENKKVNVLSTYENSPFDHTLNFPQYFYRDTTTSQTYLTSIWEDDVIKKIDERAINYLVLSNGDIIGSRTKVRLNDLRMVKVRLDHFLSFRQELLSFYDNSLAENELQLYLYLPVNRNDKR